MQLFPSEDALRSSFKKEEQKRVPVTANRFWMASVIEDAKTTSKDALRKAEAEVKANLPRKGGIEMYSPTYYAACTLGGILACGTTHTFVTPLDVVKCRRQVDPTIYKGNVDGWRTILRTEGTRGIVTGWSPTFIGYSFQGAGKYGFYEVFKKTYADLVGAENAYKYKTSLYLAASASAEVIADVLLCPWEAIKVRMQTTLPPFAKNTREGWNIITAKEGVSGLYKGLQPLWGRQIPYTMMKFASFENIVAAIYNRLDTPKSEMGKLQQTGISFVAGYLAGILCAVVSHPADVMVSKLNAERLPGEGAGASMSRIYQRIGFGGLWNGLTVRIFMIGTLTGLQWTIYDAFKVACG